MRPEDLAEKRREAERRDCQLAAIRTHRSTDFELALAKYITTAAVLK